MDHHEYSSGNLLIVGGTSSLSPQILDHAIANGYTVTATSRSNKKPRSENVRWINFDLEAENEPQNFLNNIKGESYTHIIFLIGETSLEYKNKSQYLNLHFSRTLELLDGLQDALDPINRASLIYLSSRAAIHPSYDPYYSAVKGGIVSAVRSFSLRSKPNHFMISVVPGLIIGTTMFHEMSEESRVDHMNRANNKLLTKEEFAEGLFQIISNLQNVKNGEYITIGQDYE